MTGIMNIGQSNYINAIIECLSNIQQLTNNLLQKHGTYNIQQQPLCFSYSNLLFDLFHTKLKSIDPGLFKQLIEYLNPIFQKKNQDNVDAEVFLLFIIDTLHEELLSDKNNKEIDLLQQEMNSLNEHMMFKDFLNEYNCNSTIV